MRDILLTLVFAAILPVILARPYVGAYAWAWVSLMNPQRLVWGFAQLVPFAQIIAIVTMVRMLFSTKRNPFPINSITVVYMSFLLWMSLTSLFALNTPEIILERWVYVMKIHIMMFITLLLLRGRKQIDTLIWVVTLSLAYYGVKGGIFTIITGAAYRVYGPASSTIEGNNELAVALVILIPFIVYLYRTSESRAVRWLLGFSALMCGVSILGSQSRGAFLALATMVLFLGLKSSKPVVYTLPLVALLVAAIMFMPETWSSRMETILDYQKDSSALSRVYVWKMIWALAIDRPFMGAGFAANSAEAFARYAPAGFEQFAGQYWVAHSIYFQALGEHGFPGLALYLALGWLTWRRAARLARDTAEIPEFRSWVPLLMKSIQVSLLGFAVGGAFLALVHFDFPYYMAAFVVLADATVRERVRQRAEADEQVATVSSLYGALK